MTMHLRDCRQYLRVLYQVFVVVGVAWLAAATVFEGARVARTLAFTIKTQVLRPTDGIGSHILLLGNGGPYGGALAYTVDRPAGIPVLYLVITQNCNSCPAALNVWASASQKARRPLVLLIIADGSMGSEIDLVKRRVKEAGAPVTVHQIPMADPNRFMAYTGISVTPMALAFRPDDSYVCAIAGVPPEHEANECLTAIHGPVQARAVVTARHGAVSLINPAVRTSSEIPSTSNFLR